MRSFLFYSLIMALSIGCSSPEETQYTDEATSLDMPRGPITASELSKEDTLYSEDAELIFAGDFTETLTREIYPDDLLTIRYDLKRMTECEKGGRNYLQYITGYYQVDEQAPEFFEYIPNYTTSHRLQSAKIRVPKGEKLAFWFHSTDTNGCEAWDSNLGQNYSVSISQPSSSNDEMIAEETVITFHADGDVTQSQVLKSGSKILVRYDLNRLTQCESVQNQIPQWGITGHFKTDQSEEHLFNVTENIEGKLTALDAEIELPEGTVLDLWFTATNRYGCFEEDPGASFEIKYSESCTATKCDE